MDVDVPNAGAGVPATPPQSNSNTPQRSAAAGGSRSERRQADSAVPESPLRQAVVAGGDSEEEELLLSSSSAAAAFLDTARTVGIRSQRSAGKLRSRARGAELGAYEGDGEGQGGVEHSDFFNDFGQKWDCPE
ncbi:hypothetical protein H4217_003402 [Coemansia sp. RSA 1939]|nr:hypothetical protein H4217_003402 [Coemansia sp. RSA 1939]KAJ2612034.1 hypothetical protein EV177_003197 [Coemansia sp. RSA 1804]